MKVRKLRNVPKRQKVIEWLVERLKADALNTVGWPMMAFSNRPDNPVNLGNIYVLEHKSSIVPAYILVNHDEALVLWVDAAWRGHGYAKFMVDTLSIKYCITMVKSA